MPRINAGPLSSALSRALAGRRQGEEEAYKRTQNERQYQDSVLMRELAAKQTRESHEMNQTLNRLRLGEMERRRGWEDDPTTHPAYKSYIDAGMTPARARAAVLTPALADDFLRPPPNEPRPLVRDQLRERVEELTADGLSLEAANAQARKEFGYTISQPRAATPPMSDERRNLPIYERRVGEAQRDVTTADRAIPQRPTFGFGTPAEEQGFVTDSSAKAGAASQARAALERAKASRDSVASAVTGQPGRPMPARSDDPSAQSPAPPSGEPRQAMQAEFDRAAARYKRLLAAGADPEEAQAAYNATLKKIAQKYGAVR